MKQCERCLKHISDGVHTCTPTNLVRKLEAIECNVDILINALERLARLGNGVNHGNSIGNDIAIDALRKYRELSK